MAWGSPGISNAGPAQPPRTVLNTNPLPPYPRIATADSEQQRAITDAESLRQSSGASQNQWKAQMAALEASRAGLGYNMSYTDPTTGVGYNYSGSGKGAAGGAGGGDGGDGGGRMVDWNAGLAAINPLLPSTPAPIEAPAHVTGPTQADRRAAEAAAFARAKDRIGQTGAGAMTALTRSLGRRGLSGSGIEGAQIGSLVSGLRGQLGDTIREQTLQGLARDQAVEDRNYAGDISQRTTDMGFGTTQRGQDIQAMGQRASSIPALMSLYRTYQQGRLASSAPGAMY